ncbi:hypothetical protein NDU88_002641 [Pleurodeles waltl]|uniref:Peptidase A2 domain-containing protein n=1 Tax=Pleurodeles waltl TaxID=8319 RepID=A0AAV7WQ34_PLEWA|nr:hypothetical protein NDU88_002641 [Pleurodeles waltl]
MEQEQVMLPQQVTGQKLNQSNNTVQQFLLHSENGINYDWVNESSDDEECVLAASLKVDQKVPYVKGKVIGHKVSFLVDTGATCSMVRTAEVPNLPLSGKTVQIVGVANQYLANPISELVQVKIGNFKGSHIFVVCDSSPVTLLGRDLLCKTGCSITCSNDGMEIQMNSDDENDPAPEAECEVINEEYPLISFFPVFTVKDIPPDLQGAVKEKVWDLTGKEIGLIKGVELVKVLIKLNLMFPQIPQYHMPQDIIEKVARIIAEFVNQGVLKEVMSSPCNSPIMGLKPVGKYGLFRI